jgi:exo-beta-1,3-glucanase (GH17 family)
LGECSQAETIIPLARDMDFRLFLNIWVDGSPLDDPGGSFSLEMNKLDFLLDQNLIDSNTILAFSVGSENYYRQETSMTQSLSYLEIVQQKLKSHSIEKIPLTITDIDKTYMAFDNLFEAVDFASINAFPFFDSNYGQKDAEGAIDYLIGNSIKHLAQKSREIGKLLVLTETGW